MSARRNWHSYPVKKRKKSLALSSPWLPAALWLAALFFTLWLAWAQWSPAPSGGMLGRFMADNLLRLLGQACYLLPPLLIYGLMFLLRGDKGAGALSFSLGAALSLSAVSCELALLKNLLPDSKMTGGWMGGALADLFSRIFGGAGAALCGGLLLVWGVNILFDVPWGRAVKNLVELIKADFAAWREGRLKLKTQIENARGKDRELAINRHGTAPRQPETKPQEPAPVAAPVINRTAAETGKQPPAPHSHEKAAKKKEGGYILPGLDLLTSPPPDRAMGPSDAEIQAATQKLADTLASFNIEADVTGVSPGPVVTRYEIKPRPGVKVSSIVGLSNDIALAMKAYGIRVEAPIPGKDAIGFELPNEKPAMVYLREILEDPGVAKKTAPLMVALGRYANGAPAFANLEKMPHLLVAGATNSGKSICLQTIIVSILCRSTADKVKFLLIDPKRLELTFYENIPHLYDPNNDCADAAVVTDPKNAVKSLQALVKVMETRYKVFEAAKVKNIESYNRWAKENGKPAEFYIIVIIDELADLMLQTRAAVEDSIQRLAQMARAVGIHLVLCTQRPSVDIITGVIKANLPSRIALQVASKMDSRVILDYPGADSLLGKGDMLYLAIDAQRPSRIQGAYVSENEINNVADFLRAQGGPDYPPPVPQEGNAAMFAVMGASPEDFRAALKLVAERRRVSQDLLKAHFGSSARATNMLSILEMKGFIHKPEGSNRWEIQFDRIEHQLSVMETQTTLMGAVASDGEPEAAKED